NEGVSVNAQPMVMGVVHQVIGVGVGEVILVGMKIAHLHNVAGRNLVEVLLDDRSLFCACVIVAQDAVGFIACTNSNTYGKVDESLKTLNADVIGIAGVGAGGALTTAGRALAGNA